MWKIQRRVKPQRMIAIQDEPRMLRHREGAWWLLCLVTLCAIVVAGLAHAESALATAGSNTGSVPATLLLGAIALVGLRRARLALRTVNE